MSRFLLLIALLLACVLAACDNSETKATSAPTATPAAVTPRVVALSPAIAIALRDIGHADLIVGRHGFDAWTDQSIPVCGDQSGIDYEALLAVRPTHVLVQWGERDLPARLRDLAARHGWALHTHNPLSLDEVRAMAVALWREFTPPTSPPIPPVPPTSDPDWLARLDAAWSPRAADLSRVGRVLILHGVSPPNALGPGSFHAQILQRLGAAPAVTTGTPYITLDIEDVLRLAPDAIILLSPRPPGSPPRTSQRSADELLAELGPLSRLDIPAARHARIAVIDDPECLLPSTSLIRIADAMGDALETWAADGR